MNIKSRVIITLVCSLLIFAFGMFRILSNSVSSISLIVAYVLAISGFIGVIANGVILRRLSSKES